MRNVPHSNNAESDKIILNTYICILSDLLEMDDNTIMLAQDVNNCFAKYFSEYMIQESKKVMKKVKVK